MSLPTFQYSPLRDFEFRLLKIQRGAQNNFLGYSIIHIDVNDAPEYEAVSYVWGSAELSQTIKLMDETTLLVTAGLAKALPFLIDASQTGHLWVDQITIDQLNTTERNNQVKIMGEIYSRCARCLIWIDSDPFADDPFLEDEYEIGADWSQGMGQEVLDFFQSFDDDYGASESQSPTGMDLRRISTTSTGGSSGIRALRRDSLVKHRLQRFFDHPWFKRVWVFQEFVLAPHSSFLIGSFELPAEEIERVFRLGWMRSATWYNTLHWRLGMSKVQAGVLHKTSGFEFLINAALSRVLYTAPETSTAKADTLSTNRHIDGFAFYESMSYSDILDKMGGSQTSDKRDHVYAFIGLAPCLLKHMRVDYSLPVEQCFAAMMKALITEAKCLDFWAALPTTHDASKSTLSLPSWVSDWTFFSENTRMLTHDNHFNACGPGYGLPVVDKCQHFDVPTLSSARNELIVAGKIIDTVQHVLRPDSAYQVRPSLGVDLQDYPGNQPWEKSTLSLFLVELRERNGTEDPLVSMKALLRTLWMDGVQWAAIDAFTAGTSLYRRGIQVVSAPHYRKVDDTISALLSVDEIDLSSLPYGATLQTLHELSRVQYQMRVAYCANGKLALAPDLVEIGDFVVILHGSRTPIILRACRLGTYKVIGQCYYDGAMYGEMADEDDDAADILTLT